MILGIDFGLTVTDALVVSEHRVTAHAALTRPGPATTGVVDAAVAALGRDATQARLLAVSGGRSRLLPDEHRGMRIVKVEEPVATATGGLALAGVERALVVSCGTGTAMIDADAAERRYAHVTGTPVGGGTLEGLGSLLFGASDAPAVASAAAEGSAGGVDTTLGDVLGRALGGLPPTATAVSFGRVASLDSRPSDADIAAGLCVMVAQTIGLLALNTARALSAPQVVFVGRVAQFPVISSMLTAVFAVYRFPTTPLFPSDGERATALGAALHAGVSSSV